jgi:hypothetical protein
LRFSNYGHTIVRMANEIPNGESSDESSDEPANYRAALWRIASTARTVQEARQIALDALKELAGNGSDPPEL